MFAQVIRLQYWQSEHDETTCEDSCGDDSLRGLFAVADGAGTTLFSNIWARVLVTQFLAIPLMSDDPFEVEWWVRHAQELYKQRSPLPDKMAWNALQKIQNEGSHSTLATVRISQASASSAQAELLVFGDSCVFVYNAGTEQIQVFPLKEESDFELAPICIPSKLSLFNRYFHRCHVKHIDLRSDDTIVLATDAVSRWIVSAGKGRFATTREALKEIIMQTPATWERFIQDCRQSNEMVDDDSTALVISLRSNAIQEGLYLLLGSTAEHSHEVRKARKKAFERAIQAQNKELIAIYYGDGVDLGFEGIHLPANQVWQARQVADALREVLSVLRDALNSPDVINRIQPVWQKHAPLLEAEPCAEHLRQTLMHIGVSMAPPASSAIVLPLTAPPSSSRDQAEAAGAASGQQQFPEEVSEQVLPPDSSATPTSGSSPREVLLHEREQLELEKQFLGALHTDDDEVILDAYYAVQQSPYAQTIVFSQPEAKRIELAQRRMAKRQFIREAIESGNADRMAQAHLLVQKNKLTLSEDDQQRLELANRFMEACNAGNDKAIILAFEDILHSPYHGFFTLTPQEEELVSQAWHRKMDQVSSTLCQREATAPTISEVWFRKVCAIKGLYLWSNLNIRLQPDQLDSMTIEDLTNDQYIQEGIEEVNQKASRKMLDPETLLSKEFKKFKSSPRFDYGALLNFYQLTDDEVKAILRIFLRAQLLTQYFQQGQMQFHEWLAIRKREGEASHSSHNSPQERRRSKLLWWRR